MQYWGNFDHFMAPWHINHKQKKNANETERYHNGDRIAPEIGTVYILSAFPCRFIFLSTVLMDKLHNTPNYLIAIRESI